MPGGDANIEDTNDIKARTPEIAKDHLSFVSQYGCLDVMVVTVRTPKKLVAHKGIENSKNRHVKLRITMMVTVRTPNIAEQGDRR